MLKLKSWHQLPLPYLLAKESLLYFTANGHNYCHLCVACSAEVIQNAETPEFLLPTPCVIALVRSVNAKTGKPRPKVLDLFVIPAQYVTKFEATATDTGSMAKYGDDVTDLHIVAPQGPTPTDRIEFGELERQLKAAQK